MPMLNHTGGYYIPLFSDWKHCTSYAFNVHLCTYMHNNNWAELVL